MSRINNALSMFYNGGPNDRSRENERDKLRRNVQHFCNNNSHLPVNHLQSRRIIRRTQQMTGGVRQQEEEQEPQNESPSKIDFNHMPTLDLIGQGNMSDCYFILYIKFLSF
jgi:hypothetical protein